MKWLRGTLGLRIGPNLGIVRRVTMHMNTDVMIKVCLSILFFCCLAGCSLKSLMPGEEKTSALPAAGEQLNLSVTPEEAIVILREVAQQHGWKLVRTGDQLDMQGSRGKYFWLQADKVIGGRQYISGVFFKDPAGTYVMVGDKDSGLPESLVQPLMAAVGAKQNGKK